MALFSCKVSDKSKTAITIARKETHPLQLILENHKSRKFMMTPHFLVLSTVNPGCSSSF